MFVDWARESPPLQTFQHDRASYMLMNGPKFCCPSRLIITALVDTQRLSDSRWSQALARPSFLQVPALQTKRLQYIMYIKPGYCPDTTLHMHREPWAEPLTGSVNLLDGMWPRACSN